MPAVGRPCARSRPELVHAPALDATLTSEPRLPGGDVPVGLSPGHPRDTLTRIGWLERRCVLP